MLVSLAALNPKEKAMNAPSDLTTLTAAVRKAVDEVTITDIHTHLFPPAHGDLLLWGIDEQLVYHYLVAEMFTVAPSDLKPEAFWKMPKARQAELVWDQVFLRHGGLSEAARGVITSLNKLGLDASCRDLNTIREYFNEMTIEEYLPKVFELANIDYAVMTNDPFKAEEVAAWEAGGECPARFKTALRIDELILNWPAAARVMKAAGYETAENPDPADEKSFAEARRFLSDWAKKLDPMYLAASMPPTFHYPADDMPNRVLDNVVLPLAAELNLPLAMMIGVYKLVNPALRVAGDAVGIADMMALIGLCRDNPNVKFLVTVLSRVNQHELCVTARKFGNLHVFGCWWYCNDPSIIDEITRQRLELLGATFTCQHSDARVLDQMIYKWAHARTIIGDVLIDKYRDLHLAGWRTTEDEIRREVRGLFGGMFEQFLAK